MEQYIPTPLGNPDDENFVRACLNGPGGSEGDFAVFPLAMAYVPRQCWRTTYETAAALEKGTIFPELDLPFTGKRGNG